MLLKDLVSNITSKETLRNLILITSLLSLFEFAIHFNEAGPVQSQIPKNGIWEPAFLLSDIYSNKLQAGEQQSTKFPLTFYDRNKSFLDVLTEYFPMSTESFHKQHVIVEHPPFVTVSTF
jgi:hypothetical protein